MAKDCCWNCKYYIAKGDNEPSILRGAVSNVCVLSEKGDNQEGWAEKASATPPNYVCRYYEERFY